MIRFITFIFVFWCSLLTTLVQCRAQETTWESAPISTQLEMDNTIVPVGKGAIFCPAMTAPDNEPVYGVLSGSKLVQDANMGHRKQIL